MLPFIILEPNPPAPRCRPPNHITTKRPTVSTHTHKQSRRQNGALSRQWGPCMSPCVFIIIIFHYLCYWKNIAIYKRVSPPHPFRLVGPITRVCEWKWVEALGSNKSHKPYGPGCFGMFQVHFSKYPERPSHINAREAVAHMFGKLLTGGVLCCRYRSVCVCVCFFFAQKSHLNASNSLEERTPPNGAAWRAWNRNCA